MSSSSNPEDAKSPSCARSGEDRRQKMQQSIKAMAVLKCLNVRPPGIHIRRFRSLRPHLSVGRNPTSSRENAADATDSTGGGRRTFWTIFEKAIIGIQAGVNPFLMLVHPVQTERPSQALQRSNRCTCLTSPTRFDSGQSCQPLVRLSDFMIENLRVDRPHGGCCGTRMEYQSQALLAALNWPISGGGSRLLE